MKSAKPILLLAAMGLAGCGEALLVGHPPVGADKSVDMGTDSKGVREVKWGIWVNPDGCDHWISDDGVEGYLVSRLDPYGKPICSGSLPPTYTAGHKQGGANPIIGDPL